MEETCRLCMQEHSEMIPIFEKHLEYVVSDLIRKFIPELYLNEKEFQLNKFICSVCFDILSSIDRLKTLSIDNDRIQRALTSVSKVQDELSVVKLEIDDCFVPICNSYTIPDDPDELNANYDLKSISVDKRLDVKDFVRDYEWSQDSTFKNSKSSKERRTFRTKDHGYLYFKCHDCLEKGVEKTFQIRAKLEEHILSIHIGSLKERVGNSKYFKCSDCRASYLNISDLRTHLFFVHEKDTKNNVFVIDGNDHMRRNTKSKKSKHKNKAHFFCDVCQQKGLKKLFHAKARLQEHILVEHLRILDKPNDKMKYFDCDICNESFIFFDEFQTHVYFAHRRKIAEKEAVLLEPNEYLQSFEKSDILKRKPNAKKYSCDLCAMGFLKESRLVDHMSKNHEIGFKCVKCNVKFKSKKDLLLHNNIHVDYVRLIPEEIEMKYECILCGFNCTQENELYQHLPAHLSDFSEDVRILVCNNCSTIIKDYEALHSHLTVHNEKVTHECLKCNGKRFPMGARLLRHLMKHKINEKLKCDYENCTFSCATRPQMKDHVKHKHFKEVVHLCSTCGASFGQPGSLRNHIKNIHEKNNFIYQCKMCPMTFRVPSHLRNHQAVHTTEYDFKCEYPGCTKAFRAKRNLKLHQRFHNRNQLNYKFPCDFCDRMFLTKDAVRRHSFTHTKVKPFICNFTGCDRAFSQSNDLNKHLRTHYQQEETYFCSYLNCKQSFRLKTELRYHEGLHYQNRSNEKQCHALV